ncbi:MAG TPA: MlaD family protein [Stellaceae bacterium]|nr:MlaD family protein [Stellaceae bacterium]
METRANYTLIGLFTLVVIAGAFGFIYWFQGSGGGGNRGYYQIAFDGSVNGLRTGSAVMFNGIRVGEVRGLSLDPKHSQQVLVTVAVDKSVPIYNNTDIGLEFQGLTGIASLSLKGGSGGAVAAGTKAKPPLLEAPAGSAVDVTQSARDVMRRLDKLIAENQKALHEAIENINKFSAALANSTDKIDSTLTNVDKFSGVLATNAQRFDHIAQGLEDLTGGKDGKGGEINETVRSVHSLVTNVDKRTAEIATGVNRMTSAGTKQIDVMSASFQRTLSTADRVLNNLDKNPSRLIWGGSSPSAAAPKRQ